jgi:4'-phosphopantetheinyl transferase
MKIYWLTQNLAEVPPDDDWLSADERAVLDTLRFPKRRAEWRLGRWTAKRALAAYQRAKSDLRTRGIMNLNSPDAQVGLYRTIEIRAAADGAPEAFVHDKFLLVPLSISHRNEIGFCVINPLGSTVGCDLEMIEPRSENFVADYFTTEEQQRMAQAPEQDRHWLATLIWSAKESALKALRQGLRLDTRSVIVDPDMNGKNKDWNFLSVRQTEASRTFHGWWRIEGKFVQTIVAEPFIEPPVALQI